VEAAELAYLPPAAGSGAPSRLQLTAGPEGARVLLLGGEPLGEEIVMWWNFIGRSHDEVVAFRDEWQAQVAGGSGRFGEVGGDRLPLIPAPELPHVRLKARR
ncbi:MAG: pirin-like C-terminal cupin domain-containing protein, partial [Nocardioides sp.]